MTPNIVEARSLLAAAVKLLDLELAGAGPAIDVHGLRWRVAPGGPLTQDGIDEMERRFEAKESDGVISRAMGVSIQGVRRRRDTWRARKAGH